MPNMDDIATVTRRFQAGRLAQVTRKLAMLVEDFAF